MWREFMDSQETNEPTVQDELHQLMTKLSLHGSQALAAVAEVAHEVAEQWLTGRRPIPAEIVVMLRGLAAIHAMPSQKRR